MPLLTSDQKDDVRFHLAYTPGGAVDEGDRAMLESALDADYSAKWITRIEQAIAACDYAHRQLYAEEDTPVLAPLVGQTVIAGDVNRSTTNYDLEPLRQRRKNWIAAGDDLAAIFGVVNYRTPELFQQLRSARRVR